MDQHSSIAVLQHPRSTAALDAYDRPWSIQSGEDANSSGELSRHLPRLSSTDAETLFVSWHLPISGVFLSNSPSSLSDLLQANLLPLRWRHASIVRSLGTNDRWCRTRWSPISFDIVGSRTVGIGHDHRGGFTSIHPWSVIGPIYSALFPREDPSVLVFGVAEEFERLDPFGFDPRLSVLRPILGPRSIDHRQSFQGTIREEFLESLPTRHPIEPRTRKSNNRTDWTSPEQELPIWLIDLCDENRSIPSARVLPIPRLG